jgi:hypothetical protein
LSSNSEKIKKTLKEFNSNFSENISFAEVSIPSATIFKDEEFSNLLNEEKIQACQTYCLYQHAVEQEKMTVMEMKALLHHTERENQNLLTLIVESAQDDRYQLGRKHMLMMFKLKAEKQWFRYLSSLSEVSDRSAESQVHSFINMPLEKDFMEMDNLFGEISDLSESDDSETE